MRQYIILFVLSATVSLFSQVTKNDGDWSKQYEVVKNTPEAEIMIRVGDIDNLNNGFPEDFNPFSGKSTDSHPWPYDINPDDIEGTDRVMIPTGYAKNPDRAGGCGGDGYSSGDVNIYKTVPILMPLDELKNIEIKSASLLMFVDDFQSPGICSKFRVWFNSKRFTAVEKILAGIDQSGPIGKIIYAKVPDDMLQELKKDKLVISIDDSTTNAPDGFAIDFIKLLINPKPYSYLGTLKVAVKNSVDMEPITGAIVSVPGFAETKTDAEGKAQLRKLYAGLVIADFSASGFISKTQSFDVIANEDAEEYEVYLDPLASVKVELEGRELVEGESLILNNIQFKVGSSELQKDGKNELSKVVKLMKQYPKIEIELSGHTSSEGDAEMNRKLSLSRVESCRKYLSENEISEDRITTIGYGPDKPIAPNDTETNRAKNRRVELKITRIQ